MSWRAKSGRTGCCMEAGYWGDGTLSVVGAVLNMERQANDGEGDKEGVEAHLEMS